MLLQSLKWNHTEAAKRRKDERRVAVVDVPVDVVVVAVPGIFSRTAAAGGRGWNSESWEQDPSAEAAEQDGSAGNEFEL